MLTGSLLAAMLVMGELDPVAKSEFERVTKLTRQETLEFVAATNKTPFTAKDTIVLIREEAPKEIVALGAAEIDKRVIAVFVKDLEKFLSLDRDNTRFKVAVGRILAHELEHVRRGNKKHDKQGWFRSCADRKWLTEPAGIE